MTNEIAKAIFTGIIIGLLLYIISILPKPTRCETAISTGREALIQNSCEKIFDPKTGTFTLEDRETGKIIREWK